MEGTEKHSTVLPAVLNVSPAALATAMEVKIRLVLLCPCSGVSVTGPAADLVSLLGQAWQLVWQLGDAPDDHLKDADAFLGVSDY
jgi:hypothetical protein